MTNNIYPTKFDELDIVLEGYPKTCYNLGPVYQTGGCKANDNLNLFIGTGLKPGEVAIVFFQFNKGPYKGAGFAVLGSGKIRCYEHAQTIPEVKSFCEKVMGCSFSPGSGYSDYYYNCPDL